MGYLLPVITSLKEKVALNIVKCNLCKPLGEAILEGIEKRFRESFLDKKLILAALIHPKFKDDFLEDEERKEEAWNWLLEEIKVCQSKSEKEKAKEVQGDDSKSEAEDEFNSFFPAKKRRQEEKGPKFLLEKYKDRVETLEELLSESVLLSIFRKYNTGLPSSAAVERLFSVGAGIFKKNRFSLSDENFEKHLLLKLN
ncbi:Uncharacterised protein r2_g3065 [Pycnogonum litorale]